MSSFSRQPQINTNPAALITCEQIQETQQTLELNNNKIARITDNAAKTSKVTPSVKSPNINKPDTNNTQTNQETTKIIISTNQTKTNQNPQNTLKPEEPVLKRQSTFDELPTGQRDILYRLNRENEFHARHRDALKKTPSTNSTVSMTSNTSSTITPFNAMFSNLLGLKTTSQDSNPSNMYSPLQTTEISSENRQVSTSNDSTGSFGHSTCAEQTKWKLWSSVLNDFENFSAKNGKQLMVMVNEGIPHHFRAMAWMTLSGAHTSSYKSEYSNLLRGTSLCEKMILRDIERTYPNEPSFKKNGTGVDCLFNVMKAYSLVDREVGYCQGTAFIAGLLLMHVPEEDAFAVFCELMISKRFGLRELYKPGMHKLELNMFQLHGLLMDHAPDLANHFIAQNLALTSFASSWILTVFTRDFTIKTASRVIDCLFLHGPEVIFRVSLAILLAEKDRLMSLDMEGMLKYLQDEAKHLYDNDPDLLIQKAFQPFIKIPKRRMERLEKEYHDMKVKEAEEQVELRRLRDDNNMLNIRIDALETENRELSTYLAKSKVEQALGQEEKMIIKRELGMVKKQARSRQSGSSLKSMGIDDKIDAGGDKNNESNSGSNSIQNPLYSDEFVLQLQQELVAARLREAESDNQLSELKGKLKFSDDKVKRYEQDRDHLKIQQDLANVKYKFAESQSSYRELQARLDNLVQAWTKQTIKDQHNPVTGELETQRETNIETINRELIAVKMREAQFLSDNKDKNLNIIELEQKCQSLSLRVSRSEDERAELQYQLEHIEATNVKSEAEAGLRKCSSASGEIGEVQVLDKLDEVLLDKVLDQAIIEENKVEVVDEGSKIDDLTAL